MKVWVGNLGKYNEGELVGGWLHLPTDKQKIDDFLRNTVKLQLTKEEVDLALKVDGVCYEEYYIADVDGLELTCYDLYEYESLDKLNLLACFQEKCGNVDVINAYCNENNVSDIFEICNVIEQESDIGCYCPSYEAYLSDDELLGYWCVDEVDGGIENLPEETLDEYIDYEMLGRNINANYSQYDEEMPETAGEFYFGDADISDKELGERYVSEFGISKSEKTNLFDYEEYGRQLGFYGYTVVENEYGSGLILDTNTNVDISFYTEEELYEIMDDEGFEGYVKEEVDEPDICDD